MKNSIWIPELAQAKTAFNGYDKFALTYVYVSIGKEHSALVTDIKFWCNDESDLVEKCRTLGR